MEMKSETTIDTEESQEAMFARRGCCFFPFFGSSRQNVTWERIGTSENEDGGWWSRGVNALKKVREWSELVAGPKWKTFIRRFNKKSNKPGRYQYDPLSYSLNFDDGPGQNSNPGDDHRYQDFSSRYASIPVSTMCSMDLGKDGPSFT